MPKEICASLLTFHTQKEAYFPPPKKTSKISKSLPPKSQSLKQPSGGVLKKRSSENMQRIYRKTSMPKCEFNKVALQHYWNHTSAWVLSFKFAAYFQNNFSKEHLGRDASVAYWRKRCWGDSYKLLLPDKRLSQKILSH